MRAGVIRGRDRGRGETGKRENARSAPASPDQYSIGHLFVVLSGRRSYWRSVSERASERASVALSRMPPHRAATLPTMLCIYRPGLSDDRSAGARRLA
jgi:hypothetical protein